MHLSQRHHTKVLLIYALFKVLVHFEEGCFESGDAFTVIKQMSTGFNDRTAKYKEEFVPLLQPVIIHNEGDR